MLKTIEQFKDKLAQSSLELILDEQPNQVITLSYKRQRNNFTETVIVFKTKLSGKSFYGNFDFSIDMKNKSFYYNKTNIVPGLVDVDFFYHLLVGFEQFSFEYIQERLKVLSTAAVPATMVLVNTFLRNHPEISATSLLKGSCVRWKKVNTIWYAHRYTFVDGEEEPTVLAREKINWLFTTNHSSLSLATYLSTITTELTTRTLLPYSTKATDYFSFNYGKTKTHTTILGVELELDHLKPSSWGILETLKNHAIFKRDGSVSAGVEICTAPATLDVHLQEFKTFFNTLAVKATYGLQATKNCGLHVHVDKSTLTNLHIANIHKFMNNPDNNSQITKIAGREANSYCKTNQLSYGEFIQIKNSNTTGDRFSRINLKPEKTIEFRLFASTTNYLAFKTRLEFTQAVVDYTRPSATKYPVLDLLNWDNFVDFIKARSMLYASLFANLHPKLIKATHE